MFIRRRPPPEVCFCVPGDPQSRIQKARQLIRPWEVAHLFQPYFGPPRRFTAAEEIAEWMRKKLARGELFYMPDPEDCDRWCSPAVTLRLRGGDCDDLAILIASMLKLQGVETSFAAGWSGNEGHAWVEGWDKRGPFLLEATSGELFRHRPSGYFATSRLGRDPFALQKAIEKRAMLDTLLGTWQYN